VDGREVAVERWWVRRPRVLLDGTDAPRDRWDRAVLPVGPDGRDVEVRGGYDVRRLVPLLHVGERAVPLAEPVPVVVRVVLVVVAVLSWVGLGGGLAAVVALLFSARLLATPGRTRRHEVLAVALPFLATAAATGVVVVLGGPW